MNRTNVINEIESYLGEPWNRLDTLSDAELMVCLANARAYAKNRADGIAHAPVSGVARMDAADKRPARTDDDDYSIDGNIRQHAAARRARELLGQPSRYKDGGKPADPRSDASSSTDENAARARMREAAAAQFGQPSILARRK